MTLENKDCPCCASDREIHTSEGIYNVGISSMIFVEGLGWHCNKCGYTEPDDGR